MRWSKKDTLVGCILVVVATGYVLSCIPRQVLGYMLEKTYPYWRPR